MGRIHEMIRVVSTSYNDYYHDAIKLAWFVRNGFEREHAMIMA